MIEYIKKASAAAGRKKERESGKRCGRYKRKSAGSESTVADAK